MRSVYEPEAVCIEETNREANKEMKMRVRVISQTFTDLWRNRAMLNPLKSGFYAIELISHKLFRYLVPVFLVSIFLTSAILSVSSIFFAVVLLVQVILYAMALIAWILEKLEIRLRGFAIPLYFVLTNFASVIGFYKFLKGERYATWEPIRESGEGQVSASDRSV